MEIILGILILLSLHTFHLLKYVISRTDVPELTLILVGRVSLGYVTFSPGSLVFGGVEKP